MRSWSGNTSAVRQTRGRRSRSRSAPDHAPRLVATLTTDGPDQNVASAIGSRGEAVVAWTNLLRPDKASVTPSAGSPFAPAYDDLPTRTQRRRAAGRDRPERPCNRRVAGPRSE